MDQIDISFKPTLFEEKNLKKYPEIHICPHCAGDLYFMIGWSYCPWCGNDGNPVEIWKT